MLAPELVMLLVRFGTAVLVSFVISLGQIRAFLLLGTCFLAKTSAAESILAVKPISGGPCPDPGFPSRPSSARTVT
jgi:hypothetical protein